MLSEDDLRLIEAHHSLRGVDFEQGLAVGEMAGIATFDAVPARIDLEVMWHRGRFASSLQTPSIEASEAWLSAHAEELLPLHPESVARSALGDRPWHWFARENGRDEGGIFKRSGMRRPDFDQLRRIAEQRDVLFRLEPWHPPDHPVDHRPFLYMTDSGLLHHLLGLPGRALANWEARLPVFRRKPWELRREASWEGFAISCIMRAAGTRALASYWRGQDGEIDLILDWRNDRTVWAIEITLGRKKALNKGFESGCAEVQAERVMIVHGPRLAGFKVRPAGAFGRAAELMTLEEAVFAVWLGP